MKNKIYILILIITLFIGFGATYWYFNNMSAKDMKANYYLDSTTLFNEFISNKPNAELKYASKIIEVTGTVQEIYSRDRTKLKVILRDKGVYQGVSCIIDDKNEHVKEPLRLGSLITLKGVCDGITGNVLLLNCVIIKS